MDINKLKHPDDWAKDYESPITVQMLRIQDIAQQIEANRENAITLKITEQIGVNVDKDELKRALAYDRDQYRRGYEDGWRARSKDVPQWIPITYRPMTEEEEKEFCEKLGIKEGSLEDWEKRVFTCHLPDDGQEILTSFGRYVQEDICSWDEYGCGLENNGDWVGINAWMPKPEPYKEEGEE